MRRHVLTVALIGALSLSAVILAAPPDAPVALAAMRGDIDMVRTLLQQGTDVNAALGDGMTALHWAAERNDVQMTEMLIYAGANPAAFTRIGQYTPLHIASRAGNVATAEALIESGANVTARTTASDAEPIHMAAASGNAALVAFSLRTAPT